MPAGDIAGTKILIGDHVKNYVSLRQIRMPGHVEVARLQQLTVAASSAVRFFLGLQVFQCSG